jgi:hypothetical protein
MKNENTTTKPAAEDTQLSHVLFANDECGDSMWDIVLKEAEERMNEKEAGLNLSFSY